MATLGQIAPPLLFAVGVVGLVVGRRGLIALQPAPLLLVVVCGLAFQAFHAVEHLLQTAHWLLRPADGAWLTPWAAAGRDAIATGIGATDLATEVLHLVGNALFLAAVVGALALARPGPARALTRGAGVQVVHLVEHVVLTATLLVGDRAIGVTNLLGLVPPGSGATAGRILLHAVVNTLATMLVLVGARHAWRDRGRDGISSTGR